MSGMDDDIQVLEVLHRSIGSRKSSAQFLELSKFQLYVTFHAIFIGLVLLYQSVWLFSNATVANCYVYNGVYLEQRGNYPGTLVYNYQVKDKLYVETTTRDEIPLTQTTVSIRYLTLFPSISRVDSFQGTWGGFLVAWLIFFVITSMIFFIPNDTMPRNSYFYFTGKKPFIHMIVK